MHRIAFHSDTTKHLSLQDDLKLAKQTGYSGIVCTNNKMQMYLDEGNQKELKKDVKDSGMAIYGVSNVKVNLAAVDEEVVKLVKRYARLVRAMKGNFVTIIASRDGTPSEASEAVIETCAAGLGAIAEGASEYGVNLAIEPAKSDSLFTSPVKVTYIINKTGRENIGFVFDTFAFCKAGISIEELETIERFFYTVYLADIPDKKRLKESDRLVVGEGILDFERILRIIKECNYRGAYTVKMHSDYRTKARNKGLLKKARESLRAYLDTVEFL